MSRSYWAEGLQVYGDMSTAGAAAAHVLARDMPEKALSNGNHRSFGGLKSSAVVPQKFSTTFSWGRTDFPRIWEEPEEPMPVI
jgi:hypothetical protein